MSRHYITQKRFLFILSMFFIMELSLLFMPPQYFAADWGYRAQDYSIDVLGRNIYIPQATSFTYLPLSPFPHYAPIHHTETQQLDTLNVTIQIGIAPSTEGYYALVYFQYQLPPTTTLTLAVNSTARLIHLLGTKTSVWPQYISLEGETTNATGTYGGGRGFRGLAGQIHVTNTTTTFNLHAIGYPYVVLYGDARIVALYYLGNTPPLQFTLNATTTLHTPLPTTFTFNITKEVLP